MTINNKLYLDNCKKYFGDKFEDFKKTLDEEATKGFFINSIKGSANDILKNIDFDFKQSNLNPLAYLYKDEHISKSKAYELGLIYPQGIESSFSSYLLNDKDVNVIVDMCSAPGGKSINFINKYRDAILISNDVNYKRSLLITNNFERLGIDNAYVTSLDTLELSNRLQGMCDLVILDAPCSGEGMARKTSEIFDSYSDKYIDSLVKIQEDLLENAYNMMNNDSTLIYSTCTYSFKEDEEMIINFLNKHNDCRLVENDFDGNISTLKGTCKLSFLNNSEGQFIAIIHKDGIKNSVNFKYLKPIKNKIVDDFIKNNINVENYFLYKDDDRYFLSFKPLIDLKGNVLRKGIYLGDTFKDRFIPSHTMYRANSLVGLYKYEYELNDDDYDNYISGLEIKCNNLSNNYYHLTYHGYSLGFGKVTGNVIKNKFPKGLRK